MTSLSSPLEEIKNKINLVDLVSEYVPLKKAGSNYKALCPFHSEKTPSFFVSPDKQIWHCFGCGKGGDHFGFLMEIEGLSFGEALRVLAGKAGVTLKREDPKIKTQRNRLLDLLQLASQFFHKALLDSKEGKIARYYLIKRGIKEEVWEDFKLGYAPDSWEITSQFFKKRGFSEEEIFLAGLSVQKEKGTGYYDRFRGRLMFPLADYHGRVVGFGGRALKEDIEAKYINTPQTQVYNKSQILFGLYKAKNSIREKKEAVVVEGYMDVLSIYQIGIKNVVATGGTALTSDQINLLKRYAPCLVFAFDNDEAGEEAALRGLKLAFSLGLNVKILKIPLGKDPDECIRKNKELFLKALKNPPLALEYYFSKTWQETDFSKVEDKKRAVNFLIPLISFLNDPIERSHYLKILAEKLDIEEKYLIELLEKIRNQKPTLKPYSQKEEKISPPLTPNRPYLVSERLLALVIRFPQFLPRVIQELIPNYLVSAELQSLYKKMIIYYNEKDKFELNEFLKIIKNEENLVHLVKALSILGEENYPEKEVGVYQRELLDQIKFLKKFYIHSQLKNLNEKLKELENRTLDSKEKKLEQDLIKKIQSLTQQLKILA